MPFTVRPARPDDLSVIAEFNRRLALESENLALDPQVLTAGVGKVLADPQRGRYFVADEAGEVIGQIMITYEWSDWRDGWIWWIQSVYVRADRRKAGVFRSIFELIEETARTEGGVVALRLYVEKDNHAAQTTYRRLGFEEMHFHLLQKLTG
jgi:ribosomal protein S18 acetylase RimI-like enzyme